MIARAVDCGGGVVIELPEGYDGLDAGLFRAMAGAMRPRPCTRPSEWAVRHVVLTATMGVTEPGPFRLDYLPWQRAIMDLRVDYPAYRGWVAPKSAQIGVTWAVLPSVAQHIAERMGNVLYLMGREEDTSKIARERFSELTAIGVVAERLGAVDADDVRADTGTNYPFDAGTVTFSTAGSVAAVSSTTFPEIVVDEFDQCENAFKKGGKYGDLLPFVQARQGRVFGGGFMQILAHPTDAGKGIMWVFDTQSTQHRWVFDCPNCGGPCDLNHTCIVFEVIDDDGRPDPFSHRLICPRCREPVTDAQRKAAVWERGTRPGASGEWWTPLSEEECAPDRRPLRGAMVNGLMDPGKTSLHFARLLASAWGDPEKMKSTLNTHFGEVPQPSKALASAEVVDAAFSMSAAERPALPGGPLGAWFITSGADVQSPRDNPTLFACAVAAMGTGDFWVVDVRKLAGWTAYNAWLGRLSVPLRGGEAHPESGAAALSVDVEAIDSRYLTGQVMGNCRLMVTTPASRLVQRIPVQFEASSALNKDVNHLRRNERRSTDPDRPHLGPIEAYDLHRHYWVDLAWRLYCEGRVRFVCPLGSEDGVPTRKEIERHFRAQFLKVKKASSGWEKPEPEWDLIKGERDDWFMAFVYALAAAWLGRTRAGTLSERVYRVQEVGGGGGMPEIVLPKLGNHGEEVEW